MHLLRGIMQSYSAVSVGRGLHQSSANNINNLLLEFKLRGRCRRRSSRNEDAKVQIILLILALCICDLIPRPRVTSVAASDQNEPISRHLANEVESIFIGQPKSSQTLMRLQDENNNNNNNNHYFDLHHSNINNSYDSYSRPHENSLQDYEELNSDTSSYPEEPTQVAIMHKYFDRAQAEKACQLDRGSQRSDELNNTYLTHCTRYRLIDLFSSEILMSIMHEDSSICRKFLDEFIQLDELINQFDTLFKNLLRRYNCQNGYSVKWNCEDCKVSHFRHNLLPVWWDCVPKV